MTNIYWQAQERHKKDENKGEYPLTFKEEDNSTGEIILGST